MSRAAFFAFVPSFPGFVGADGSVRPAKHASETRKSSANSQLPLGGQGRPPLHRLGGFCVPGLDIFAFAVYTTDKGSATGKRARSPELLTRSNRWFAGPGGYFFLLLQTLITRLITLTMRIQNWNNSVYVTISRWPPFLCVGGQKKLCPSAKRGGEPPACRLSVAPCSQ